VSDILERILATKRREVEAGRAARPMAGLEAEARSAPPTRGFAAAIRRSLESGRPAVIAEIKRASPSQGAMRADLDPAAVAASYEANGATCLSVLTDRDYFSGSPEDLRRARGACTLPVLRKDFILDPWQVFEARAIGADCILLIVDAVEPAALRALESLAGELGMDVLVECHDARQLEVALGLRTPLIGVNNRDLRTFQVHLETTIELAKRIPAGRIVVSESGIRSPVDVERLKRRGVSAYLVGGAFMVPGDPGAELARVFGSF
jgi:indole-3-glycerol phosphate synthase